MNMEVRETADAVPEDLSDAQFEELLDEFSTSETPLPVLPATFSREDIYFDHD